MHAVVEKCGWTASPAPAAVRPRRSQGDTCLMWSQVTTHNEERAGDSNLHSTQQREEIPSVQSSCVCVHTQDRQQYPTQIYGYIGSETTNYVLHEVVCWTKDRKLQ